MSEGVVPAPEVPPKRSACFIIMPISDQEGYRPGHFKEVYDDLIGPAVTEAGYDPIRADQVHATNLIHLDIIGKLLDAPMAVCDLSSVNPNVMFELGIRQAFDKPVVLLKDGTTRNPFDISPMRYVSYDEALSYRGMLAAREGLLQAINATIGAVPGENINSIVSLLGLRAAAVTPSEQNPETARMTLMEKSVKDISSQIRNLTTLVSARYAGDYVERASAVASINDELTRGIAESQQLIGKHRVKFSMTPKFPDDQLNTPSDRGLIEILAEKTQKG